ncbi:PREDICTED: uncharacterized protein LOC106113783 [Papilio xuthus]|uniref:Uncharacterized protein LOC106113783 n=1 Tax=Papilio xuthus TaxID=66420 RepID=A0AAJ6YZP4_PAPXU|nr:PREDICTED: uncharacterized protein LOC106113783 [Papilio xuthus]
MYFEMPNITKCCFCIPLRYGLLAWAYFKLAWCIFLTTMISIKLGMTLSAKHFSLEYSIPLLYCLSLVIELIITIIFIIGAHKKNPKLLRVYYIYAMVFLGIIFLLCLLALGLAIFEYIMQMRFSYILQNIYETSIFGTGVILFNLYLLSLVRSEILKLENNTQFSFQNIQNEPTCTMEKIDV